MNHPNWKCPKCRHSEFSTDRFRASGGGLASIFDIENKKFSTVSCQRCGYTEMYRTANSRLENILDLITT
ncbi:MAG: zinc ribbon domain-containing protein [Rhodothermales bacterium]|nr:zinc ribbon domain-containing protein [Rhodothermales bacterium]MBO6779261.1 zinc ribbon domain-containing protein [Rhodothermales bacterium]